VRLGARPDADVKASREEVGEKVADKGPPAVGVGLLLVGSEDEGAVEVEQDELPSRLVVVVC
jgi:hypothetical protein